MKSIEPITVSEVCAKRKVAVLNRFAKVRLSERVRFEQ
jgi:hypothetical protein